MKELYTKTVDDIKMDDDFIGRTMKMIDDFDVDGYRVEEEKKKSSNRRKRSFISFASAAAIFMVALIIIVPVFSRKGASNRQSIDLERNQTDSCEVENKGILSSNGYSEVAYYGIYNTDSEILYETGVMSFDDAVYLANILYENGLGDIERIMSVTENDSMHDIEYITNGEEQYTLEFNDDVSVVNVLDDSGTVIFNNGLN